jgi:hypothetical protein
VVPDLVAFGNRLQLMGMLRDSRIAAMSNFAAFAEAGGLVSYRADRAR